MKNKKRISVSFEIENVSQEQEQELKSVVNFLKLRGLELTVSRSKKINKRRNTNEHCKIISFYSPASGADVLYTFIKCDTRTEDLFIDFCYDSYFLSVNNKIVTNHSECKIPFKVGNLYSFNDFEEFFDFSELKDITCG